MVPQRTVRFNLWLLTRWHFLRILYIRQNNNTCSSSQCDLILWHIANTNVFKSRTLKCRQVAKSLNVSLCYEPCCRIPYLAKASWSSWILVGIRISYSHMYCIHPSRVQDISMDMTKPTKWLCAQRRLRSAWASAQSDQSLRCPHEESLGP